MSVFDASFIIRYEQVNHDLDHIYATFAAHAIRLADIPPGSDVLDLGCGTGISAAQLVRMVPDVKVIGVDEEEDILGMAWARFGLEDPEPMFREIRESHPYPPIARQYADIAGLEACLRDEIARCAPSLDRVAFHSLDATRLSELDRQFGHVLASQAYHWLRRRKREDGQPGFNLEYEGKALQQVHSVLTDGGLFAFNTSGADFQFEEPAMNERYRFSHPFYQVFMEAIRDELGEKAGNISYAFDHAEIERVLDENGFRIVRRDDMTVQLPPDALVTAMLVGGHMQIYQKLHLSSITAEDRDACLARALKHAFSKTSPAAKPFFETGVHYVAKKI